MCSAGMLSTTNVIENSYALHYVFKMKECNYTTEGLKGLCVAKKTQ